MSVRSHASAVAIGLIVACAPSPPPVAAETPTRGGRIVETTGLEVFTLQPVLSVDVAGSRVISKIYDSLVRYDPRTGEAKPNLGTWSISSDGLTYTWEIDAGATWSDGRPITGEDYLAQVKNYARSKKTVRKGNFRDIVGFKQYEDGKATRIEGIALDAREPKRFAVTFARVFCPALSNAFGFPLTPAHVFGKYAVDTDPSKDLDDAPENLAPPVASGPFTFKEWRKGDEIVLTRNDRYWRGAPFVDEWILKFVAGTASVAERFKTSGVTLGNIVAAERAEAERLGLKVFGYQQLFYRYIGWNVRSPTAPALADRRIRQALAYGLDVDAVIKQQFMGEAARMVSPHLPTSWALPSAGLERYGFDQDRARQLIGSAGYVRGADGFYAKGGTMLEFTLTTISGQAAPEALLQVATDQYRQIGVKVKPRLEPLQTFNPLVLDGALDAWIYGWNLGADPDPFAIWSKEQIPDPAAKRPGFNSGGYTRPEVEQAMIEARTPSNGDCSQAARKKHYETFNRLLNEDQPYNFGYAPNALIAVDPRLHLVEPGPFDASPSIEKWWLAR